MWVSHQSSQVHSCLPPIPHTPLKGLILENRSCPWLKHLDVLDCTWNTQDLITSTYISRSLFLAQHFPHQSPLALLAGPSAFPLCLTLPKLWAQSCHSVFMHDLFYPLGMIFLTLCSWLEYFSVMPPLTIQYGFILNLSVCVAIVFV